MPPKHDASASGNAAHHPPQQKKGASTAGAEDAFKKFEAHVKELLRQNLDAVERQRGFKPGTREYSTEASIIVTTHIKLEVTQHRDYRHLYKELDRDTKEKIKGVLAARKIGEQSRWPFLRTMTW